MEGGPPLDRFRPPDPVTMLNQQNLYPSIHESSSDSSYNSSQSHEVQHRQKSSEIPIPILRNQPVTAARSVGESPKRHAQDCNIQEVIRPEFAIWDCNTDRRGHPKEVSSSFHGGNIRSEASGDSTGILATDFGKLVSTDELWLFTQQKNPHREGKPSIDNSHPTVTPTYNVSANELHRIENDPSKAWVAKEHGNSGVLRLVHGTQNRATNRTDQQQYYHSNFPRIFSNFDRQVPKSATNDRTDHPQFPSNTPKLDQVVEPAPYTVVQTYADRFRHDQAKCEVRIHLTAPEITTKQGTVDSGGGGHSPEAYNKGALNGVYQL
ncbi:hypothetical protein KY285_035845 [Solanum tuberosum]|nr:hypothetical protein KY285_035845 [Solanum tuberosum]